MPKNNGRAPRGTGIAVNAIRPVLHDHILLYGDNWVFAVRQSIRMYVLACFACSKLLFLCRTGASERWCADSAFSTCPAGHVQLCVLAAVEFGASVLPAFLVSARILAA